MLKLHSIATNWSANTQPTFTESSLAMGRLYTPKPCHGICVWGETANTHCTFDWLQSSSSPLGFRCSPSQAAALAPSTGDWQHKRPVSLATTWANNTPASLANVIHTQFVQSHQCVSEARLFMIIWDGGEIVTAACCEYCSYLFTTLRRFSNVSWWSTGIKASQEDQTDCNNSSIRGSKLAMWSILQPNEQ